MREPWQEGHLLSWFLFGSVGLLALLTPLDERVPWLPFLCSAFLLGLPHGAGDWLILAPRTRPAALRSFLLYSVASLVVAALAILWTWPVLLAFLVLTVVHFGSADERDLGRRQGRSTFTAGGIARIGLFFSLVLLAHPAGVLDLAARSARLLGADAATGELLSRVTTLGQTGAVAFGLVWLLGLGLQIIRKETVRCRIDVAEGSGLVVAAVLLEPVFAVGLYFLVWHSLRHLVDLGPLTGERHGKRDGILSRLIRVHRRVLILLVPSWLLLAALVWGAGDPRQPSDWVAALVLVFLIFTPYHHLLVERWRSKGRKKSPAAKPSVLTVVPGAPGR